MVVATAVGVGDGCGVMVAGMEGVMTGVGGGAINVGGTAVAAKVDVGGTAVATGWEAQPSSSQMNRLPASQCFQLPGQLTRFFRQ